MDWYTWLSKTGLNPALVYEYGLAFTHNELEEDDLSYFDHEFLQSMGVSIAKHRLEILKLARKHRRRHPNGRWAHRPDVLLPRLLLAIRSTKRRVEKYIKSWVHNEDDSSSPPSSALVLVHKDNYSRATSGYHGTVLKRNKKAAAAAATNTRSSTEQGTTVMGRLLLTNGSHTPARDNSFCESPVVCPLSGTKKKDLEDQGYWSAGVEEIRYMLMVEWGHLADKL
ncbi:uncharacterized protein LOC116194177 isoform X2 [Punica granatum]|uniref:Uncharacterized protein LOC116194177 isoform X2 n=1 Tax=Punica granatum TaxID=22663 RepID=A0A6P8CCN6_PUNGR|nr:uncharacterized protein LOC116194177 isoform X2 [Punica granatum]